MKRVRAYFELLRLPAVFTAVADVMMGYLVVRGDLNPWHIFALLVAGSSCLYLAGMVLNDVFDAEVDARERPKRPIPSGRVTLRAAKRLGWSLWTTGMVVLWIASWSIGDWVPGLIGVILAGAIWSYNYSAKRTPASPLIMGFCRSVNVILSITMATYVISRVDDPKPTEAERAIALAVCVYIAGVTWFAGTETRTSRRWRLWGAMVTMLLGLFCYWASAYVSHSRPTNMANGGTAWLILWVAIAGVILRRCYLAVVTPEPMLVQNAVRTALRSLIVIDAALVLGFCGPMWAFAVLVLLVPMLLLERWASTT